MFEFSLEELKMAHSPGIRIENLENQAVKLTFLSEFGFSLFLSIFVVVVVFFFFTKTLLRYVTRGPYDVYT